jgi:hypothetical protein
LQKKSLGAHAICLTVKVVCWCQNQQADGPEMFWSIRQHIANERADRSA